jgi:D-glycero-alpha-D-manno-heptose-7-phosphate kinase|tara:strand:- start:1589 stop:2563 length:975 start_codon:yes stop_codon:yes gene_type:complete
MIITQTPFRLSFAGGGTDLKAFYEHDFGAVFSVALNHHIYVTVHRRFENNFRVSYSKTEFSNSVTEIPHDLVRESLLSAGINQPLEVTTIADVPAGTGLGSSSTLTVGLLNAFRAVGGQVSSSEKLAQLACDIEIDTLGNPIGKQDQYAAAFGGMNYIRFNSDGTVRVDRMPCERDVLKHIESHSLMVYTDQQRSASKILEKQTQGTADKLAVLTEMRDMAGEMKNIVSSGANMQEFGQLLDEGWRLKRSLGFGITNNLIDDWYEVAKKAGAIGGKLLGAGGGGFLYFIAPPERHERIVAALGNPKTLPVSFDSQGSRVVFISD